MDSGERALIGSSDLASNWQRNLAVADQMVKTGFLPKTIRTKEQAVMIMETGRELGLPPIESLRNIFIVDQKPALASQLMLSLLYRSEKLEDIQVKDNDKYCTVTMKRKGMSPYTVTFSEDDARKAGLLFKDNWKRYPKNMYRARAVSMCARVVAPDVVAGLYTKEELEAGLDVENTDTLIEESKELQEEDNYAAWLSNFMANLREELPKMTEPGQVQMFKKAVQQDLKTMIEADRLVAEGEINNRFQQLVTENPPKSKLEEYIDLANQCKDGEDLIQWFHATKTKFIEELNQDECSQLAKHCTDLKRKFDEKKEIAFRLGEESAEKSEGEALPEPIICQHCNTVIDEKIADYSASHFIAKKGRIFYVNQVAQDETSVLLCRTCQESAKQGNLYDRKAH